MSFFLDICLLYYLCMTNRKSSSHKVIAAGAAEDPRAALSLPNERLTENVEVLIPMISEHFIDAKVRQTKQMTVGFRSFTVLCSKGPQKTAFLIYFLICFRMDLE